MPRLSRSVVVAAVAVAIVAGARARGAEPAPAPAAPPPATRPAWQSISRATRLKPYVAFAWGPASPLLKRVIPLYQTGPDQGAGVAALASKRMPDGCRAFLSRGAGDGLLGQPADRCRDAAGRPTDQDGVWPDRGAEVVERRWDAYWEAFARAGGTCDFLVLDYEENWSNWVMKGPRIAAIQNDPRFPALAERLGFGDLGVNIDMTNPAAKPGGYLKWNAVTGHMLTDAMNRSIARPLWARQPAALASNYGCMAMTPDNVVPEMNAHRQYSEGPVFGNVQSPQLYAVLGGIALQVQGPDWRSPMTDAIYTVDVVRAGARSSPLPIIPWVAFRSYKGDDPRNPMVPLSDTDYWQECLYHSLLGGGGSNVLFFNSQASDPRTGLPMPGSCLPRDAQAMEDAMAEMERAARGSPLAVPLTIEHVDFSANVLFSAARTVDGRTVARVTFGPTTKQADVEFAGRTLHVVRPEGRVGAWVEVP